MDIKLYSLVELKLDEITKGISIMVDNADDIWDSITKHYPSNFFDKVVDKHYGALLQEKS